MQDLDCKINPSVEEFIETLKFGLKSQYLILFAANCEVEYKGRARSKLGLGDRLIIIKKDKSILIHRPTGYKPINWQPPYSNISILRDSSNIPTIISTRINPWEEIRIKVIKTYFILVQRLTDTAKFEMYLTEKEMQDIISKNIDVLIEPGMRTISTEKEVETGVIDILAKDKNGFYVVIELKKDKIGEPDVLQLYRYILFFRKTNPSIRGIIVGPSIRDEALSLLRSLNLEYKKIDIKRLSSLIKKDRRPYID